MTYDRGNTYYGQSPYSKIYTPGLGFQGSLTLLITSRIGIDLGYTEMNIKEEYRFSSRESQEVVQVSMNSKVSGGEIGLHATF